MYTIDLLKCTFLQSKSETLKIALTILTSYVFGR